jgi:hypothetical protein
MGAPPTLPEPPPILKPPCLHAAERYRTGRVSLPEAARRGGRPPVRSLGQWRRQPAGITLRRPAKQSLSPVAQSWPDVASVARHLQDDTVNQEGTSHAL